jgi:hypothetical protein
LNIFWKAISPAIEQRIEEVVRQWEGTPYMAGQRARGIGVDCVQLVGGVLDMLFRRPQVTIIPRLSPDSGLHCDRSGFATAKAIRNGFESIVVRDEIIEPGDVLVVRGSGLSSGPRRLGHTMIALPAAGTAFHATFGIGACRTTVITEVLRIYRPLHKEGWL